MNWNKTPEYTTWVNLRSRCYNPNNVSYRNYGGRGIKVCDRWNASFKAFLEDMGMRPTDRPSIERLDNAGDYSPENCAWVSMKTQQQNRRNTRMIEHAGIIMCLNDWARTLGISHGALTRKLERTATTAEAIQWFLDGGKRLPRQCRFYTVKGETRSLPEWLSFLRVGNSTFFKAIKRLGTPEAAIETFLAKQASKPTGRTPAYKNQT